MLHIFKGKTEQMLLPFVSRWPIKSTTETFACYPSKLSHDSVTRKWTVRAGANFYFSFATVSLDEETVFPLVSFTTSTASLRDVWKRMIFGDQK